MRSELLLDPQEAAIGSTQIQITLPPELAQAFLNSVEHALGRWRI